MMHLATMSMLLLSSFARSTLAFAPGMFKPSFAVASLKSTPAGMAEKVLATPQWPPVWPFSEEDFARQDEQDDAVFYEPVRLCYHIDDAAIGALTEHYEKTFQDGDDVLDICSSWVSHFPKNFKGGNCVGLGMNEEELSQNKQINSYDVKDLNKDPVLPYEDNCFDKVTCVVSIDYLNKPLEVVKEIGRVLRPGGTCMLSMSNRW